MSFLFTKVRYVSSLEAHLLFLLPRDQAAHIVTPRRQVRMLREPKVECEQHCLSYFRAASAAVGRPVEMRHMTSMMKTMRPRWQNRQQDWRSWRKMWVNSRENKICATTWWPRFCTPSPKRAVRQARCAFSMRSDPSKIGCIPSCFTADYCAGLAHGTGLESPQCRVC